MSYPIALLNNPPAPTYPEYAAIVAEARQIAPRFVDPRNLHPERDVVQRRGNDWGTAVLGRPYWFGIRVTVIEQYILIVADMFDVDPPLPEWIAEGRRRGTEMEDARRKRKEAARQRDIDAWTAATAGVTIVLDVYLGTNSRVRGDLVEPLGHAVPRRDAYSGTRTVRLHRAGRAVCESPTRSRPLGLRYEPAPDGTPATCTRCLSWTPKIRANSDPEGESCPT